MHQITAYTANIVALPLLYANMLRSLRKQRRFIQQTLVPEISSFRKNMDNSLGEDDFNKIYKYYGLAVPAILGEAFSLLRGTPMSEKERFTLTYLGALTGLFDDFSDKLHTPQHHVRQLIDKHREQDAENSHELLFVKFVNQALKHIKQPGVFLNYANKVFEMQLASNLQKDPGITQQQIRHITYHKGGYSLLFYRSAMNDFVVKREEEMVFNLGSLMQLENDLFDVYKDRENNISTLVTSTNSIKPLRTVYEELLEETFRLFHQSGFSKKHLRSFLRYISVVLQRGKVCLDQLEKLEKQRHNKFALPSYSRKELICDMEKPANFLQMIHYYAAQSVSNEKES